MRKRIQHVLKQDTLPRRQNSYKVQTSSNTRQIRAPRQSKQVHFTAQASGALPHEPVEFNDRSAGDVQRAAIEQNLQASKRWFPKVVVKLPNSPTLSDIETNKKVNGFDSPMVPQAPSSTQDSARPIAYPEVTDERLASIEGARDFSAAIHLDEGNELPRERVMLPEN